MSSQEESFEESLARLEKLTTLLESPDTGLEEAIDLYEQGTKLARACMERLEQAEQRVERLREALEHGADVEEHAPPASEPSHSPVEPGASPSPPEQESGSSATLFS